MYYTKIRPYIHFYKQQIASLNQTAQYILKNEIDLIYCNFLQIRTEKRGIISSLISDFIRLAYEGISSFLHHRRHKALHKAVKAMETKTDIQLNKIMHLEDSMAM